MSAERRTVVLLLLGVALLAGCGRRSSPTHASKPNLVIVIVDALRPDHLGCYGYPRPTSPRLDRLAAEGVRFDDVTSQATWTLPSVWGLLTSSYPLVAGVTHDVLRHTGNTVVPVERVSMPVSAQGELRKLGYTTLASTGGGFVNKEFGFNRDFDWLWTPPTDHYTFLPEQLETLKTRLAQTPPKPFFLLLHTHEVHNYLQAWGHNLAEFDHGYKGRLKDKQLLFKTITEGYAKDLSEDDLQYLRDLYDGEIKCADATLGGFFDWLFAQSWGQNTVVMIIADHGELFGEHGFLHHGLPPYHALTRVPLIVRFPDGAHQGEVVRAPVLLADLMPTLIELAGGKAPAHTVGQSLLPVIAEEKSARVRPTMTECRRPPVIAAREGRWYYLNWFDKNTEELYDLATDPAEKVNLVATRKAELAEMRGVLAGEVMRAGRGYRVVVAGPRPAPMTITLSCARGFNYLFNPTGHGRPVISGEKQATVMIPAGEAPQVVLVKGGDAAAAVGLEAQMGGKPVPAARIHLGTTGRHPAQMTVTVGAGKDTPDMASVTPPSSLGGKEWGVWIWSLPDQADQAANGKQLSEETRRQLKSLGYVK